MYMIWWAGMNLCALDEEPSLFTTAPEMFCLHSAHLTTFSDDSVATVSALCPPVTEWSHHAFESWVMTPTAFKLHSTTKLCAVSPDSRESCQWDLFLLLKQEALNWNFWLHHCPFLCALNLRGPQLVSEQLHYACFPMHIAGPACRKTNSSNSTSSVLHALAWCYSLYGALMSHQ